MLPQGGALCFLGDVMQSELVQAKAFEGGQLVSETRADGSVLIWQREALPDWPRCMTARFLHWAEIDPERIWMAERDAQGEWQRVSYGQGARAIRAIGAALLAQGLSVERPLLILSGNSLAHALMALGAQHVGRGAFGDDERALCECSHYASAFL